MSVTTHLVALSLFSEDAALLDRVVKDLAAAVKGSAVRAVVLSESEGDYPQLFLKHMKAQAVFNRKVSTGVQSKFDFS